MVFVPAALLPKIPVAAEVNPSPAEKVKIGLKFTKDERVFNTGCCATPAVMVLLLPLWSSHWLTDAPMSALYQIVEPGTPPGDAAVIVTTLSVKVAALLLQKPRLKNIIDGPKLKILYYIIIRNR